MNDQAPVPAHPGATEPSLRGRPPRLRVAVLASGRGSNLQALIDAERDARLAITLVLVAGDRAVAPALRRAERAGIDTVALEPKSYATRAAFDADLFARIAHAVPDLIVMAGFMRIVDARVLEPWVGRIVNVHPSLLPKYRGLDTHARALAAGDQRHGASVHFVTADLDAGAVIAQASLATRDDDDAASLALRLLPLEHALLVASVGLIADGRVALRDGCATCDGIPLAAPLTLAADGRLDPPPA